MRPSFLRAVACALGLVLAVPSAAADLTIFAAASLKTALDEAAAAYTEATGTEIATAYAGSSVLARQITQGAPGDIFISASPDWMDVLETEGLLAPDTRSDLFGNELVLIAHDPNTPTADITPALNLPGLLGDGRLAMALTEAVPAGIYGRAALVSLGLWDAVAPRIVETDNVRAALALVALGEAPLGIVYASDARAEPRVHVVGTFPGASHSPIIYPAGAIASGNIEAAIAFLAHLRTPAAQDIFARAGFTLLPTP